MGLPCLKTDIEILSLLSSEIVVDSYITFLNKWLRVAEQLHDMRTSVLVFTAHRHSGVSARLVNGTSLCCR